MKAKLITLFLIVATLGTVVAALQLAQAQPVAVTTSGPAGNIHPSYEVSSMVCLQDSSGQIQRLFLNVDVLVGQLDTDKYKLILSSAPDSNAPVVVDDAVFINGQKFAGYVEANIPYNHLGENPTVCYQGVPAIDVTSCLRQDGHVHVQGMDMGGGVYGCSALYLRVVPR